MEKKKMKLWQKILLIISIILVIFIILTLRKLIILFELDKTSKQFGEHENYYVETYTTQGNSINITKSYHKDTKYLTTIEISSINSTQKRIITLYSAEGEQISIYEFGNVKKVTVDKELVGENISVNSYIPSNYGFYNTLLTAITSSIRKIEHNGKKCYIIEYDSNYQIWVDIETGLVVREINNSFITDYNYKFDIVKDENIEKPDLTNCTIE